MNSQGGPQVIAGIDPFPREASFVAYRDTSDVMHMSVNHPLKTIVIEYVQFRQEK